MKAERAGNHRKVFKQSKAKKKAVLNVKPYPIPELEGESARNFEQQIKQAPTEKQKKIMRQSAVVFAETKRR